MKISGTTALKRTSAFDRSLARIAGKTAPPKNKEVAEFYRKNKPQFWMPETIRAAHIVKNVDEKISEAAARSAIESIQQQLDNGASFEELADEHSDCPGNGGDLGYFAQGHMVAEFDEVVFALDIGKISPIFRTVFGFHIAKLHDKKAAGLLPLSEVQEIIRRKLLQEKQARVIEQFNGQRRDKDNMRGPAVEAANVVRQR